MPLLYPYKDNMKPKYEYLKIINCEGVSSISLDGNIKKYYANNIKKVRKLKPIIYKYEKIN